MNHHSAGQHRVLVQIGTVAFASHWRHLKRVVMTGDPLGGASVARGRVGMSVVFFGGRSEPRRPMARVSMDWSGSGGDGNCPVSSPDGQCERTPSPPPEHGEGDDRRHALAVTLAGRRQLFVGRLMTALGDRRAGGGERLGTARSADPRAQERVLENMQHGTMQHGNMEPKWHE